EHWFSVRTTRAGQLTVYTTGSTDTMLAALTSDYQFIVEVDDYEDLNARVQIPVQAGTTIFRLKAYGSNSGPYRINASFE
ncbi:MAG: hypothetical protein FWC03_12760, partial [Treponema sp.]|nr:hypothetical protein [Treponema sp.]